MSSLFASLRGGSWECYWDMTSTSTSLEMTMPLALTERRNRREKGPPASTSTSPTSVAVLTAEKLPYEKFQVQCDHESAEIISLVSNTSNQGASEPFVDIPLCTPTKLHRPPLLPNKQEHAKHDHQLASSKSLLDDELTPSPEKTNCSTPPQSARLLPWCGAVNMHCWSPQHTGITPEKQLVRNIDSITVVMCKIDSFLSSAIGAESPLGWTSSWQAWSFSHLLMESDEVATTRDPDMERHVQRVLRNRAFRLNSKKRHLNNLRHDLDPFTTENNAPQLARTLSSQSQSNQTLRLHQSGWSISKSAEPRACALDCAHATTTTQQSDRTALEPNESVCYDSDPEDFLRRRPLGPLVQSNNGVKSSSRASKPCAVPIDFADELAVKQAVTQVINDRWTLILHTESPLAVRMWIERGQQTASTIVPPRLVYQQIHAEKQRHVRLEQYQLCGVELLDIQRVLPVGKKGVMAQSKRLFCINVLTGEPLYLEAKSSGERDRIMRALKLVVASFGSRLVTGDQNMDDFFGSHEHFGPGELPAIFDC